ncbi:hypothetical protein [Streptomyces sp. NPDC059452]|uniref:hypothetical protein n=1 Tax=Streptomyces sp. NPDC059452 TaxID=3346835 RepID=UPI00368D9E60
MADSTSSIRDLLYDSEAEAVGEFRGIAGPYWSLRPVCGGQEWEAAPENVRLADTTERLHAAITRANARSRGEVL